MASRLKLQEVLEAVLKTNNVYFQPPTKMNYPCIIYDLSGDKTEYANNAIYIKANQYTITLIDRNPDSEFFEKIRMLPMCTFDRFYTADSMNHWVFELYF